MDNVNSIDLFIMGLFAVSMLLGLMRGFLREVLSIVSWIAAVCIAMWFAPSAAQTLSHSVHFADMFGGNALASGHAQTASQSLNVVAIGVAFSGLLVVSLFVCGLVTRIIAYAFESGGISLINRLLGGVFGGVRAAIVVTIGIFLVQFSGFSTSSLWTEAKFVVAFQPYVKMLDEIVAPEIESLKNNAHSMTESVKAGASQLTNSIKEQATAGAGLVQP